MHTRLNSVVSLLAIAFTLSLLNSSVKAQLASPSSTPGQGIVLLPKTMPHQLQHKGIGFPDFGHMVSPTEYYKKYDKYLLGTTTPNPNHLPIFRLKTDFPSKKPPSENWPSFLKIDFKKDPLKYLEAARDYSFEGNLPAFGGGPVAWDPFANKVREWYHIPWLHPSQALPPWFTPDSTVPVPPPLVMVLF